jgi:hypothetical protein
MTCARALAQSCPPLCSCILVLPSSCLFAKLKRQKFFVPRRGGLLCLLALAARLKERAKLVEVDSAALVPVHFREQLTRPHLPHPRRKPEPAIHGPANATTTAAAAHRHRWERRGCLGADAAGGVASEARRVEHARKLLASDHAVALHVLRKRTEDDDDEEEDEDEDDDEEKEEEEVRNVGRLVDSVSERSD